jgi:O-antigen ligase
MALESIAGGARRVSQWSAIALGFSIPVSTALDNVLIVITLVAWTLSGHVQETIENTFKNKQLLYSVVLFGLLALGTLYGETALRDALSTLGKYNDLLLIPVFAMVLRDRDTRIKALHALAIAIAITVVFSYLIRFQVLPILPFITGTVALPLVFKLKITHSLLVAFGAFLFVWLGSTCQAPRLRQVWYALALLAALNVLLLVNSATGYVTLGGLAVLFAWERMRGRGLAYGMAGLAVVVAALLAIPNAFQERVTRIVQEVQQWRPATASETSSGLRLGFYHGTLGIIAAHPLSGVGTGGFPQAYARQVAGSGKAETQNPHNEFLHITAQIGVAGLLILIAMFWQQWRSARLLDTPMEQALARGLVFTLVAGCMANSLLLDHAEGLFYAWLSGLLYASLKYTLSANDNAAAHT